jgi:hypothetical protein
MRLMCTPFHLGQHGDDGRLLERKQGTAIHPGIRRIRSVADVSSTAAVRLHEALCGLHRSEDVSANDSATGQAPTFSDPLERASLPVDAVPAAIPASVPARRMYLRALGLAAAAIAILGAVAFSLTGGTAWLKKTNNPIVATPVGETVRILAGLADGNYTDGYGHVWVSDRFFYGGSVATSGNHPIWGTRDPRLYQSWRQGAFSYDIPAKPGDYELRLYFAETYFGDGNAALDRAAKTRASLTSRSMAPP